MAAIYKKLRFGFTFFLLFSFIGAFAQNRYYDIISDGKVIGEASMVKTVVKTTPKEIRFLFSSQFTPTINQALIIKDKVDCFFRNDTLFSADFQNQVNGRLRVQAKQNLVGNKYQRSVNSKEEVCSVSAVKWSYIRFFDEMPSSAFPFMSEMFGKVYTMAKSGNTYSYMDHLGRKAKFVYDEKGNMVKAYVQTSMEDLEFVPRK